MYAADLKQLDHACTSVMLMSLSFQRKVLQNAVGMLSVHQTCWIQQAAHECCQLK